jgi:hypothetical protein
MNINRIDIFLVTLAAIVLLGVLPAASEAVYVSSAYGSDNEWRCGIFEKTINKELSAANQAYADGDYGEITGHLETAAQVASNAQGSGCNVEFKRTAKRSGQRKARPGVKDARPRPRPARVARVFVSSPGNVDNEFMCMMHEDAINGALNDAANAAANGQYDQVAGHLQEAAQTAVRAESKGCTIRW